MGDFIELANRSNSEILSHLDGLTLATPEGCEKLGDIGKYVKAAQENYNALSVGIRGRFVTLSVDSASTPDPSGK